MQIKYFTQDDSYTDVLRQQEQAVADVIDGANEQMFIGEHSPMYSLGSSADIADIINAGSIPLVDTGRGGQITYHGPGQLVVYPIINLAKRDARDIRAYIDTLQNWVVATLAEFDIEGMITDDVGVWIKTDMGDLAKIAAFGVRVRKWVTFHGLALNVNCDLTPYQGIIPCGLEMPITSMEELGFSGSVEDVEKVFLETNPFIA